MAELTVDEEMMDTLTMCRDGLAREIPIKVVNIRARELIN